jgi:succinate dehydrogenase / fumarate reductase cytochrome b subunit
MSIFKYALFTGCTAKGSTPELLMSTQAVAKKLGIELIELTEASCCGASHLQDFDDFLSLVLNARNISYAEKHNLTMVTICNTCQLNSAMTNERLKNDPDLKAKVNEKLAEVGLEFKGTSEIKHFLYALTEDIGVEKIASMVTRPLNDMSIAAFYGCHNIRPPELAQKSNGGENPYNPQSIDDLILALGGKNIDYKHKNRCCGFHADLQAPDTAHALTANTLLDAKDNGASYMVTPCPLCHLNFDTQQKNAEKNAKRDIKLPILHLPQMVGLALGIEPQELGLDKHVIKTHLD